MSGSSIFKIMLNITLLTGLAVYKAAWRIAVAERGILLVF
jgi:hypothetical protein